jgi:hypothetical protein
VAVKDLSTEALVALRGTLSKRVRTVALDSGGHARDRSLDPVVERVRLALVGLAADTYTGAPAAAKYSPDEARDAKGEWTADGVPVDPDRSHDIPHSVVQWYDRQTRSWVTETRDIHGCQIGNASFDGGRKALAASSLRYHESLMERGLAPGNEGVGTYATRTARKYSPDQPRDADGRFGEGGGLSGAVADYQSRHAGTDLTDVPPETRAQLGLPDVIPSVGAKFAAEADPEMGALALRTLDALQSRFGVEVAQVDLYDFSQGWMAASRPESVGAQVKGSNVYLNQMYFGQNPGVFGAGSDNRGWLADPSPTGVLYHEYAHILDRTLTEGEPPNAAYQSWRSGYLASYDRPSGYARFANPSQTQEERDAEAVAEAFTAAFSPSASPTGYGAQSWIDGLRAVLGNTPVTAADQPSIIGAKPKEKP